MNKKIFLSVVVLQLVIIVFILSDIGDLDKSSTFSDDISSEGSIDLTKEPQRPGDFNTEVEGPIPYLMEPNISVYTDGYQYRVPYFKVETNNEGLRGREFEREKPEDTIRILAIGDSHTFGWGVNKSDRYTTKTETRLNNSLDKNVEIINAGVSGWGIREFKNFYLERGRSYETDFVLVNIAFHDVLSIEKQRELRDEAEQIVLEDNEEASETEIVEKRNSLKEEYMNSIDENNTEFEDNLNKIKQAAEKNNSSLILFEERAGAGWRRNLYSDWAEKNSVELVDPPEELSELSLNEKTLEGPDNHFNKQSHKILTTKLTENLENILRNDLDR